MILRKADEAESQNFCEVFQCCDPRPNLADGVRKISYLPASCSAPYFKPAHLVLRATLNYPVIQWAP